MAKNTVGIDIGYDHIKLVWVKNGRIAKIAVEACPEKMVKEGRVVSPEAMGEQLRSMMKKAGIHSNSASYCLNEEVTFVRNVSMPIMTPDQLQKNLPYEFRDYITDELKKYAFDYAAISTDEESMDLMAAATPVELIESVREMVRKAGMKLDMAAPSVSAYRNLLRNSKGFAKDKEYCIIDLGYQNIRVHVFRGDVHQTTRVQEFGLSLIDDLVSNEYNVDVHLAHTYISSNYDSCCEKPAIASAFQNIVVELMRTIHFYQFSNPESELKDFYCIGGGAKITNLVSQLEGAIEGTLHSAEELLPTGAGEQAAIAAEAAGIALY